MDLLKSLIGGIIPVFLLWKATEFDKYACGCVTMGKKLAVRGFWHADLESLITM